MSNYTRTSSQPAQWVAPRASVSAARRQHINGKLVPIDDLPDPRRGMIRLTLAIVALFVLLLTVGSEAVKAILQGVPA